MSDPALRIARQQINQLLTKTADPTVRMTREGEVAALRTVAGRVAGSTDIVDKLRADWDI
jgi:hypothetical protein